MLLAVLLFAGACLYFLPALVAFERERVKQFAVFVLNLLLGWLLIPRVIALIWALSRDEAAEVLKAHEEMRKSQARDLAHQEHQHRIETQSKPSPRTKKCPYCAEDVLFEAVKCKHCGSSLAPVS